MAEDHESGSGHKDPTAENHIQSDRKNNLKFFEGRSIEHDSPTGSKEPGRTDLRGRLRGILSSLRHPNRPNLNTKEWENSLRGMMAGMTSEERAKVGSEFGGIKSGESYTDADSRHDEAVKKVVSGRDTEK